MTATEPTMNREAIHERYRAERDKRFRSDGATQYLEPTGRFANLDDDPWIGPVDRDPVNDEVTV
ncbi:MAG: monooxygenase, partial [Actinomycetia bacterium]|nr:monooxygenase [Actinomycetes bacterium]